MRVYSIYKRVLLLILSIFGGFLFMFLYSSTTSDFIAKVNSDYNLLNLEESLKASQLDNAATEQHHFLVYKSACMLSLNERINRQLKLLSNPFKVQSTPKTILLLDIEPPMGIDTLEHLCPTIPLCTLTQDQGRITDVDAVIASSIDEDTKKEMVSSQITLFYDENVPCRRTSNTVLENTMFNWTTGYRQDSVIPKLPFLWQRKVISEQLYDVHKLSYTAQVAWFVSNCHAENKRLEYAKELDTHINVHIYGACGNKVCKKDSDACNSLLQSYYYFYLAFENSNCMGYITEKVMTAYRNDVIPVVMGARRQDYEAICPPNSFIHVDDFESPEELAKYLHQVIEDKELFRSYFEWKNKGAFVDGQFWCRVCAMLHDDKKPNMVIKDVEKWWRPKNVCVEDAWPKDSAGCFNGYT